MCVDIRCPMCGELMMLEEVYEHLDVCKKMSRPVLEEPVPITVKTTGPSKKSAK